jgi:hypothetical protein
MFIYDTRFAKSGAQSGGASDERSSNPNQAVPALVDITLFKKELKVSGNRPISLKGVHIRAFPGVYGIRKLTVYGAVCLSGEA